MTMTKQEQLTAIAKWFNDGGVWSDGFPYALLNVAFNRVHFVMPSVVTNGMYSEKTFAFTRSEVEARIAELQDKPSWDNAPDWAEWLYQHRFDGVWVFASHDPRSKSILGDESRVLLTFNTGEVIGDWRETIEKRPAPEVTPEECEKTSSIELKEVPFESALNTDLKCYKPVKLTKGSDKVEGLISGAAHKSDYVLSDDKKAEMKNDAWDGDGLPPAGVECCIQLPFNDMGKCLITYMGDGVFCYRQVSSGNEYTGSVRDTVFRTIKSDREMWKDAALHVEAELHDNYKPYEFIEALYNAGLAKMPEE